MAIKVQPKQKGQRRRVVLANRLRPGKTFVPGRRRK